VLLKLLVFSFNMRACILEARPAGEVRGGILSYLGSEGGYSWLAGMNLKVSGCGFAELIRRSSSGDVG